MSLRVYLKLKVGDTDVEGESSVSTIGGVDVSTHIECESYEEGVETAQDPASGRPTGNRIFRPIIIRKWIDKSSPLLAQALAETQSCQGEFRFFRPSVETAKTEHYFSVQIENARICKITRALPQAKGDVAKAGKPPYEEIAFFPSRITWTHHTGQTEYTDDWTEQ